MLWTNNPWRSLTMGVVTDRRRVWRCFYHLPFLWLFNLNFQHVCSKLHSLTIIHYYLIFSLVSFSYFIFTSPLFILFFLFLIVFSYSKRFMRFHFHLYSVSYMFPIKDSISMKLWFIFIHDRLNSLKSKNVIWNVMK